MALATEGMSRPNYNRYTGADLSAMQVEVTGEQFVWYFRYPGADATFGRTASPSSPPPMPIPSASSTFGPRSSAPTPPSSPYTFAGLAAEPRHYAQLTGIAGPTATLLQSTPPLQRHITVSAIFLVCAQLPFFLNLLVTLRRPPETISDPSETNPWQSTTTEWAPNAFDLHPKHQPPIVYRGPSHYSDSGKEFLPQWSAASTFNTEAE